MIDRKISSGLAAKDGGTLRSAFTPLLLKSPYGVSAIRAKLFAFQIPPALFSGFFCSLRHVFEGMSDFLPLSRFQTAIRVNPHLTSGKQSDRSSKFAYLTSLRRIF
jgi:hypothetical protein